MFGRETRMLLRHYLEHGTSKSALARELGEWNITVNTISPDYIPHDADYSGRQPEMAGFISNQRCLKRDQVPDDMVEEGLGQVDQGKLRDRIRLQLLAARGQLALELIVRPAVTQPDEGAIGADVFV